MISKKKTKYDDTYIQQQWVQYHGSVVVQATHHITALSFTFRPWGVSGGEAAQH